MSNAISGVTEVNRSFLSNVLRTAKYIAVSYLISLILIVALSALVCYSDVPESVCSPGVKIITCIGVFAAAFLNGRSASGRGWLAGAIAGICNVLVLAMVSVAVYDAKLFTATNGVQLICGLVFGILGGIFGINSSGR